MEIRPSLAEAKQFAAQGYKTVPVSCEMYADCITPIELLRKLKNVSSHVFLLESVEDSKQWGRYTFLGYDPKLELTCVDGTMTVTSGSSVRMQVNHPGEVIRQVAADNKSPQLDYLPTFTGGLVGYWAYDYIKYAEPSLNLDAVDTEGFKDIDLMLFDKVIAFDNLRQKILFICQVRCENLETEYNRACLTLLGGEDAPAYQEVSDALRTALKQKREGSGKLNQGKTVLQYDITMLPGLDGQNGAIACIRDITEGERLSRTRYDYVANISHELRTPLANMRGLAEGLRDGLVTDEQERMRYYGIIVDEVRRLSRLVNDLLELSGLQSNPAAFEMEKVEPTEIMWELFDLNKKSFAEKRQTLSLEVPEEELPSIITNEDRLTEVLTIFLDNARKYTPEGGKIVLGAELSETDGIVTGVRFFVRDNGIGMDEESSRLVFERFHQADKSHAGQGSGLGLSIAREILLKLNVQIQLKTKPGEGSEFSFVLPVP